ncbi:MAG: DUF2252 domain-containing protein [Mycobacteriaceae bacterium]|nr:DUF2252 domain-containing protein [Mycobacteriaceae bacterium]
MRRSELAVWEPPKNRRSPMAVLEQQALTRVPDLVPIRYARMGAGAFPFLRGAPAVMAADLAASADTGLTVQLCGDAHLSNFGLFASPERALVFDVNDFDETLPGPFEWDVKRLAASIAVAARSNGFGDSAAEQCVLGCARSYREAMQWLSTLGETEVWYATIAIERLTALLTHPKRRRSAAKAIEQAKNRTSLHALDTLTETDSDGVARIAVRPPLVMSTRAIDDAVIAGVFADYRRTLPEERRVLLDRYDLVDTAFKVVGVGSVGTRCFIALLIGRTTGDPLFLQMKEAEQSVLAPYARPSRFRHQGHRVVFGQRLTQAASDIFLGWASDPGSHHFYCRQLRDMKGSAEIADMTRPILRDYARLCGLALARAHARSGDRVAIAAYLGNSDVFDRAMAGFAIAYADQTDTDYATFRAARSTAASPPH